MLEVSGRAEPSVFLSVSIVEREGGGGEMVDDGWLRMRANGLASQV